MNIDEHSPKNELKSLDGDEKYKIPTGNNIDIVPELGVKEIKREVEDSYNDSYSPKMGDYIVEVDHEVAEKIDELKDIITQWGRKLEANFTAINVRLDRIEANMTTPSSELSDSQSSATIHSLSSSNVQNDPYLTHIFPLADINDIEKIDEKLKAYDDFSFRKQITAEMQRSIESDTSTLKYIMTDEMIHLHNFNGAKGKRPLKDLEIVKILFDIKYRIIGTSWGDFSNMMKREVALANHRLAVRRYTGRSKKPTNLSKVSKRK